MSLSRVLQYSKLSLLHAISSAQLSRTPEPDNVTSDQEDVNDYAKVMSTVMALPYALGADLIHRAREDSGSKAIDLCCGPGLFSLMLSQELNYQEVLGIDLSEPMLKIATRNAQGRNLKFQCEDVTQLKGVASQTYDLVTFFNGAHQLPSLEHVAQALKQAERIAKPRGLILVMDPVRQKTKRIADGYIQTAGADYLAQGLPNFYRQFHDSVYASWSLAEFSGTIPQSSKRVWVQMVPHGLPSFQILFGLPEGRDQLFLRDHLKEEFFKRFVPVHAQFDWGFFCFSFKTASKKFFYPK